MPSEYFTVESLVSFAGALFFTLLIPNVVLSLVGDAFRPYARLTALAVALFLTELSAFLFGTGWTGFLVGFFNGLLIYAAAYGVNAQIVERQAAVVVARALPEKRFFQKWR